MDCLESAEKQNSTSVTQLRLSDLRFYDARTTSSVVEDYMAMHISDYSEAPELWERTLYLPARRFVNRLFDVSTKKREMHFVYIGAGREAPIFNDPQMVQLFKQRVSEITIVDISRKDLDEAVKKVTAILPGVKVNFVLSDITGGLANEFDSALSRFDVFENVSVDSTQDIFFDLKAKADLSTLAKAFNEKGIANADIAYSEMVATFTGIPAHMKAESFWQEYANEQMSRFSRMGLDGYMRNSNSYYFGDRGLKSLHNNLLKLWQIYNEVSYGTQLEIMSEITNSTGSIAVITDTLKKFDNEAIPSRPGFVGEYPSPPSFLIEKDVGFNEDIWWRDEAHTEQSVQGIDSLAPHTHFVETRVYQFSVR